MQDDEADGFYRLRSSGVTLPIFYPNTVSGTRVYGLGIDGDINSPVGQVSASGHFPHLNRLSLLAAKELGNTVPSMRISYDMK